MRSMFHLLTGFLVALSWLPGFALNAQEFDFPEPTGPFDVGITTRHLVDESREETFSDDPDDARELLVDFWYPADVGEDATLAPYLPNADLELEGLAAALRTSPPGVTVEGADFAGVLSHSFLDVPVSDEQANYPVLVFSHGWDGFPRFYTHQLQELASHGYIVAAINHPYGSSAAVFPDGRIITRLSSFELGSEAVDSAIWSQDHMFVLDQLEAINATDPEGVFTGRFDLDRVGIFGAAFGGRTASRTLTADPRFKAGLSENGGLSSTVLTRGADQPFLYLAADDAALGMSNFSGFRGPIYNLTLSGFDHANFTDAALWGDEFAFMGTGDRLRSVEVVDAYILAFFNQTLKGTEEPLLAGPSPDYPEVTFGTN